MTAQSMAHPMLSCWPLFMLPPATIAGPLRENFTYGSLVSTSMAIQPTSSRHVLMQCSLAIDDLTSGQCLTGSMGSAEAVVVARQ